MSRPVPFVGRLLDALGLLCFLAGAGAYAWAWKGLREVQRTPPTSPSVEFGAMAEADRLTGLSQTGVVLMAVGLVVAVVAAVVARRVDPTGGEASPEPRQDAP